MTLVTNSEDVAPRSASSSPAVSTEQLVNASVDGYEASPPPIPIHVLECIEHVEEVRFAWCVVCCIVDSDPPLPLDSGWHLTSWC